MIGHDLFNYRRLQ